MKMKIVNVTGSTAANKIKVMGSQNISSSGERKTKLNEFE
jgi:hypothetical protein